MRFEAQLPCRVREATRNSATPRFFSSKMTQRFASKPCPSLPSTLTACSSPGATSRYTFAGRQQAARHRRYPSRCRGWHSPAPEPRDARGDAGKLAHPQEPSGARACAAAARRLLPSHPVLCLPPTPNSGASTGLHRYDLSGALPSTPPRGSRTAGSGPLADARAPTGASGTQAASGRRRPLR